MYHSFLIHSFADVHLGCFHALAIIHSAAMNIGVHMSLSDLGKREFKTTSVLLLMLCGGCHTHKLSSHPAVIM